MLMESILEADWVLERTDIGQAEIAHRTLKLPMTARAVLLMVDGKSEITQLQRKMMGLQDGMSILESLLSNGLIRRRHYTADTESRALNDALNTSLRTTQRTLDSIGQANSKIQSMSQQPAKVAAAAAVTAATPLPATAPAPAASIPAPALHVPVGKQRRSLALARLYLLDQMERMFGPRGDALRNILRTATTREELLIVFGDCREILEETTGPERSRRIAEEFYALLPESTLAGPPPINN